MSIVCLQYFNFFFSIQIALIYGWNNLMLSIIFDLIINFMPLIEAMRSLLAAFSVHQIPLIEATCFLIAFQSSHNFSSSDSDVIYFKLLWKRRHFLGHFSIRSILYVRKMYLNNRSDWTVRKYLNIFARSYFYTSAPATQWFRLIRPSQLWV